MSYDYEFVINLGSISCSRLHVLDYDVLSPLPTFYILEI